jgi:hypothetical protein
MPVEALIVLTDGSKEVGVPLRFEEGGLEKFLVLLSDRAEKRINTKNIAEAYLGIPE